jgi:hypothetical protein
MRDNNIMCLCAVAGGDYIILYTKRLGGGVTEWSGNIERGRMIMLCISCVYTQHALIKQYKQFTVVNIIKYASVLIVVVLFFYFLVDVEREIKIDQW